MSLINSSFEPPEFDLESNDELSRATWVFHEDLLLQILLRLPVNSLLRFRCVSRSWYSLITSSEFISSHVHYNKENNNYRVLLRRFDYNVNKKVWYKLCKDNEALDELMIIDFPFLSQSEYNDFFRMVGCMNGLVCLSDDIITETDTLILWNPVIRRFLPLPSLKMDIDRSSLGPSVVGFGFDPLHRDYKVIKIQYHSKNRDFETYNKVSTTVFRLKTGCWEDRGITSLPFIDSRQAYVHGVIHWVGCNKFVMGFDVSNEEFKSLAFPKPLQTSNVRDLTIAPWCDLLSIFYNDHQLGRISLWVMKAYGVQESWVKQLVVESVALVRSLRRNGNVILQNNAGKLILYNSKTNKVEDFETHTEGSSRGFHMKSFTESLVLLDHKDAKLVPPSGSKITECR